MMLIASTVLLFWPVGLQLSLKKRHDSQADGSDELYNWEVWLHNIYRLIGWATKSHQSGVFPAPSESV